MNLHQRNLLETIDFTVAESGENRLHTIKAVMVATAGRLA